MAGGSKDFIMLHCNTRLTFIAPSCTLHTELRAQVIAHLGLGGYCPCRPAWCGDHCHQHGWRGHAHHHALIPYHTDREYASLCTAGALGSSDRRPSRPAWRGDHCYQHGGQRHRHHFGGIGRRPHQDAATQAGEEASSLLLLPLLPAGHCPHIYIHHYFHACLHADEEASSLPLLPLLLSSGPLSVFDTSDVEEAQAGGVLGAVNQRLQRFEEMGAEMLPDELHRVRAACMLSCVCMCAVCGGGGAEERMGGWVGG
eukprot:scaffold162099_cov17-Tisochrysis_lutea.AAC.1